MSEISLLVHLDTSCAHLTSFHSVEGWKVVYRVILALLESAQDRLIGEFKQVFPFRMGSIV